MVGVFQFTRWRFLGAESELLALSETPKDMLAELAGLSVALVGNSRALADKDFGADIDDADIVIRINRAPIPNVKSHGRRTDWLALAVSLSRAEAERISPGRMLWMSPKRKRLRRWVAMTEGFYLHPQQQFRLLSATLASPPTTGLMLIDLIAGSDAKTIELYGFDFFSSLSLTGGRSAQQVPHDFAAEKNWVKSLIERDARFQLIG